MFHLNFFHHSYTQQNEENMYFIDTQVQINGQSFQPNITSLNKKEAKANAAKYALQRMGFLPDTPSQPMQQAPQPVPPVQQMSMTQSYMAPPMQNPMGFSAPNTFQ